MNPAWFFSTLSQSMAAVVGFIIAVSTVTYSLERQRKMETASEFRSILKSVEQRYVTTIDSLQAEYSSRADDDLKIGWEIYTKFIEGDGDSVDLNKELEGKTVQDQFLICLNLINFLLSSEFRGGTKVPKKDHVDLAWSAAAYCRLVLLGSNENCEEILRPYSDDISAGENPSAQSVFNTPGPEKKGILGTVRSLDDFEDVLLELTDEIGNAQDLYPIVYTDNTKTELQVLNMSAYLVFIGVFVPTLGLMNYPFQFPIPFYDNLLFGVQICLLASTSLLTLALVQMVIFSFNNKDKGSKPGYVAQKLTEKLPSIV